MPLELRQHGTHERVGPFSVVDFIQLACMGHRSVRIEVVHDAREGVLLIARGRLWSVDFAELEGLEALRVMTSAQGARVECVVLHEELGAPNLPDLPYEHILLELAREQDEREHQDEPPGLDAGDLLDWPELDLLPAAPASREASPVLRVVPAPAEARRGIDAWLDEGMAAALVKDYARALRAYEAVLELDPSHRVARANVATLGELLAAAT